MSGQHAIVRSDRPVPPGHRRLGMRLPPHDGQRTATLLIDGAPAGSVTTPLGFVSFISWSGLDIGRDRGSPASHYAAPFAFTGTLRRVTVTMDGDQTLDGEGIGRAEMARP